MAIVLTTLAIVKSNLGIPSATTTYDAALTQKIEAAEGRIFELMNIKPFAFDVGGGFIEYFDGEQADRIVLTCVPIGGVTYVKLLGYGSEEITISSDFYTYDQDSGVLAFKQTEIGRWLAGGNAGWGSNVWQPGGIWNGWRCYGQDFGYGFRNVKVSYTGFEYPGGVVPPALAEAATEYSVWLWVSKGQDFTMKSEDLADYKYERMPAGAAEFEKYLCSTFLSNYIRKAVGV